MPARLRKIAIQASMYKFCQDRCFHILYWEMRYFLDSNLLKLFGQLITENCKDNEIQNPAFIKRILFRILSNREYHGNQGKYEDDKSRCNWSKKYAKDMIECDEFIKAILLLIQIGVKKCNHDDDTDCQPKSKPCM